MLVSSAVSEPLEPEPGAERTRVLAVVPRFHSQQIDYLLALADRVELTVAVSGVADPLAQDVAIADGLDVVPIGAIGLSKIRGRLAELIQTREPAIIHLGWYGHEQLTLLARDLAPPPTAIIYECRDPLTTLLDSSAETSGPALIELERQALLAADSHIFVSKAVGDYLQDLHGLDLSDSLIVPQGVAARTLSEPGNKLSATDGRVHVVMVGAASADPATGRCYLSFIRELVSVGLVVHSHFLEAGPGANDPYRRLARELQGYEFHEPLSDRIGTEFSQALSTYDLLAVAYFDGAITRETLAVVMPLKAASAWAHGAIPVVVTREMQGVVEWIDQLGIGFVIEDLADFARIASDREAIASATASCLEHRRRFTHEASAARIVAHYRRLV